MDDVTKAGTDVGGFLGGILNPLFGSSTTTTTETGDVNATTSTPNAGMASTTKYIIIGVVIVVIGVVGYLLIRKKTA